MTLSLPMKVRLVSVDGDEPEEFSDLVGANGSLKATAPADRNDGKLTFMPDNRGDWLTLLVKRKRHKDGKLYITTGLGNTFVFRPL